MQKALCKIKRVASSSSVTKKTLRNPFLVWILGPCITSACQISPACSATKLRLSIVAALLIVRVWRFCVFKNLYNVDLEKLTIPCFFNKFNIVFTERAGLVFFKLIIFSCNSGAICVAPLSERSLGVKPSIPFFNQA
jgi:hypothetical protein